MSNWAIDISKTRRIALATLFGVAVFASKIILPTPIDKMVIIVEALLLALSSLLLERMGATYTAMVGGFLTTMWRIGFFPFTFVFAIAYGLMIDVSFYMFKVRMRDGGVKRGRLVAALTLSTTAIGLMSMCVMVLIGLMPWIPILYFIIIIVGSLNGAVASYLTFLIWRKYLVHMLG